MTDTVLLDDVASFRKGVGLTKADLSVDGRHECVHYGELFTKYGAVIESPSSRTDAHLAVRSTHGDILMPTSDVTPRGLAKASALMVCGVGLGGDILIIRPDLTRVEPRFLANAIRLDVKQILALVRGSTVYHLYASDMRNFELSLPRLVEQRKVASALQEVDDLIATLERLIAKKQAIKQGMMQQLLTGKTRLPGFTGPWAQGIFEHLASPSRERAMAQSVAATTPLVGLDQIESGSGRLIGTSQTSEAASLKAVFRPGDVLFGKLRAYLRKFWYAEADGLCTTEIWVLRAKAGVHGRFVRYMVETDQFIEVASGGYGTHMPRSDWGTVRTIPVAIPSHDEQVAIASALDDVDSEIGLLRQRLTKVRGVKQGMMQQLLTGRTRLPVGAAL